MRRIEVIMATGCHLCPPAIEAARAASARHGAELLIVDIDGDVELERRYRELIDTARPQTGEASHYRRRRPANSRLDPERTLAEQFDLLRVVDNDRYPAFLEWRGRSYNIRVKSNYI